MTNKEKKKVIDEGEKTLIFCYCFRESFLSPLIKMINFNFTRCRFDSSKCDIVFRSRVYRRQQISLSVSKFWHFVASVSDVGFNYIFCVCVFVCVWE